MLRWQRYGIGRHVRLNEPRRGIALFNFALAEMPGVDSRRVIVVTRFCCLVPQAGFALLVCLVKANIDNAGFQNEVRERQQRRLEANDWNDNEFRVVMTVVTNMEVMRAIDAICDYFNWDDDRVAADAESFYFFKFKHIKPAIRYQLSAIDV